MTHNFEEIKQYIKKTYQYSGITYFGPSFDKNDWRETYAEEHETDEKHAFPYRFVDYVRQK